MAYATVAAVKAASRRASVNVTKEGSFWGLNAPFASSWLLNGAYVSPAGFPWGPGAIPVAGAGEAVNRSTPGAFPLPPGPAGGQNRYVARARARTGVSSGTPGYLLLYDRLVQTSGLAWNTAAPQPVNTVALPRTTVVAPAVVPTPVSIGTAVTSAASSTAVTFTTSVAVDIGDTILVSYGLGTFGSLASITDSAGNAYAIDAQEKNATGIMGATGRAIAKTALPVGGTITATYAGTAAAITKVIGAFKVAGAALSVDAAATSAIGSTAAYAAPAITTTGANRMLWGVAQAAAAATSTPGAGITPIADVTANVTGYRKLPSAGSYTFSGTFSTSAAWIAVAVAYYISGPIGDGVWLAIENHVNQSFGVSPAVQASYTNEQGVAGRTTVAATMASTQQGESQILALAAGDSGVRSVESVTLATADSTAGNFGITLLKPVLWLQLGDEASSRGIDWTKDWRFTALAAVDPNACLAVLTKTYSASAGLAGPPAFDLLFGDA